MVRKRIIICNGMVRSGSTLIYNLVREYTENIGYGRGMGFFDQDNLIKNISHMLSQKEEIFVLKTHDVFSLSCDSDIFYLHTVRDIRDIAVSIKEKMKISDEDVIGILEENIKNNKKAKFLENLIVIRYEDLFLSSVDVLVNAILVIGCRMDARVMDRVIENNSLKSVKKKIKSWNLSVRILIFFRYLGWIKDDIFDRKTLLHYNHISSNSGAIGAWKMEKYQTLAAAVEVRFGDWLLENNYKI